MTSDKYIFDIYNLIIYVKKESYTPIFLIHINAKNPIQILGKQIQESLTFVEKEVNIASLKLITCL